MSMYENYMNVSIGFQKMNIYLFRFAFGCLHMGMTNHSMHEHEQDSGACIAC